jgi:hypothetical protein
VFAWAYEKNECFSFRPAYRILKDLKMAEIDHEESASSGSNTQGL